MDRDNFNCVVVVVVVVVVCNNMNEWPILGSLIRILRFAYHVEHIVSSRITTAFQEGLSSFLH